MIDKVVVEELLSELRVTVGVLSSFREYSLEEIRTERAKQWQIEHGLQLAIQNMLDIGSHILSALGKNRCETYTEILDRLSDEKIIPGVFSKRIRGMAGLRNILVHDYLEVDLERIYSLLQNELGDFADFMGYVIDYLDRPSA